MSGSSSSNDRLLIVGGDGILGQALAARSGRPVIATTRRPGTGRPKLDLATLPETWEIPDGVGACVLAAAVSKYADCERDPEASFRINVDGTCVLADRLADRCVRTVFLSSNAVLGESEDRSPRAAPAPISEYGRQKAEAESRLRALGATVIRLTKVIEPGMPLLSGWRDRLRDGQTFEAFDDMVLAPVSLNFAVEAILRVLDHPGLPLVQVSASRDVTYFDLALALADRLGAGHDLVGRGPAAAAGIPCFQRPVRTVLDGGNTLEALGLAAPDPFAVLDSFV